MNKRGPGNIEPGSQVEVTSVKKISRRQALQAMALGAGGLILSSLACVRSASVPPTPAPFVLPEFDPTARPRTYEVPGQVPVLPEVRDYAQARVAETMPGWSNTYVNADGLGTRVINPDGNVYSEGQSSGLLFAAATVDRLLFEQLEDYYSYRLTPDGFMVWRTEPTEGISDLNFVTTAELERLHAYFLAAKNFSDWNLQVKALNLAVNIRNNLIDPSGALRPGNWGGSDDTVTPVYNTASFSPLVLELAEHNDTAGAEVWRQVQQRQREVIDNYFRLYPEAYYLPDWINSDGSLPTNMGGDALITGMDALRVPVQMGMELTHGIDPDNLDMAAKVLYRQQLLWEKLGPIGIRDRLNIDGSIPLHVDTHNNKLAEVAVLPRLLMSPVSESLAAEQMTAIATAIDRNDGGYYADTLAMKTLLMFRGNMA